MPLNALLECEAPTTTPASGAPFRYSYATTRTVANDPIFDLYKGPTSSSSNRVFRVELDGSVVTGIWKGTAVGAIYGGTGQTTWAKGEIPYASAADTISRLGVSATDGHLLTWNNTTGLPEWRVASAPTPTYVGARAYRSGTNQSFGAGVATKIQYNSESWDPQSKYDAATNYRYLPAVAGKYRVTAQIAEVTTDSFTGNRHLYIYKNGVEYSRNVDFLGSSNNILWHADEVDLNGTTDYVEIFAYGSDAVNVLLGSTLTFASFSLIGA